MVMVVEESLYTGAVLRRQHNLFTNSSTVTLTLNCNFRNTREAVQYNDFYYLMT